MSLKVKNYSCLVIMLFLFGCNNNPQPINYGSDNCSTCKMTIIDKKFGAELVSTKGKIYKFDDLICMVEFIATDRIKTKDISKKLVIDYQIENNFIEVEQAVFYVSDELHSPMNGNAAAFVNKEEVLKNQDGKPGVIMDWKQVYAKLK